ncbi:hypothetical protein HOY80DRAFT_1112592 [Tuber brumale]|nr:hypothetical protein HOY80DRAFT_1112592 [Tuber brumale]
MKDMILTENINRMKLLGTLNISGALEHLVYGSVLMNSISPCKGIQHGLNQLATSDQYLRFLSAEAKIRKVDKNIAISSVANIYEQHYKIAVGNSREITICAADYNPNQLTVLMAFMRVQDTRPHCLPWKEVNSAGEDITIEMSEFNKIRLSKNDRSNEDGESDMGDYSD